MSEDINFEDAMKKLEEIANELEKGDLTLEESVKKFEDGISLSKKCNEFLDNAEKKITMLINNGEEIKTRITQSKIYKDNPFGEYSILKVEKKGFTEKFKKKCIGGEWTESDELELILECYEVII